MSFDWTAILAGQEIELTPIEGYRFWRYKFERGKLRLRSPNFSNEWHPWEVRSDNPPGADDHHGFHACKELDQLDWIDDRSPPHVDPDEGIVIGRVHLTGSVFEYKDTYRAENIQPVEYIRAVGYHSDEVMRHLGHARA